MSMNYQSYVISLADLMNTPWDETEFQIMIPDAINYAELRMYRELNLVNTRVANTSANLTANSRTFNLPTPATGPFITVTGLNVITPVGSTTSTGKRNQLVSRSRMFVDYIADYETASAASVIPTMYYMRDQDTVIVGPSPGAAFNMEVIGTIRPNPLSSTNTTTFLTQYFPDMFLNASMVYVCGHMKDYAAQMQSWEALYKAQFESANLEETRKRYNDEVNKQ